MAAHRRARTASFLLLLGLSLMMAGAGSALALAAERGVVIEDFESGSVVLTSYPAQDQDPGSWELTTSNTYQGSDYALRIFGNSWKVQMIDPQVITPETVWQLAAYVERIGEMQGFGVGDGTSELFYTVAGETLPAGSNWWTVYQGAYSPKQWIAYLLPIGEDWQATHGYLPVIDRLFYVNDNDAFSAVETVFDAIIDVTADLPVPPQVTASYAVREFKRIAPDRYRAGVQFYGEVVDPDSESHEFAWDFGDSTTSGAQNPYHEYIVAANYEYTVGLLARDPDGLVGADTCQVAVEQGAADLPVTVNFVGDIMIARAYEAPGGIIDDYGVDAIFEPTYSILGDAADLSYANLECPFTDQGEPHPTKSVVFRARPENIVGVANAGIDLVTLGNNHIIDYGEEGMLQTMELLDQNHIRWSGAGVNDYFALLPAYWTERGVRMACLSLSNRTGRLWNYQPFLDAGASKPGFAYLVPKNLEESIAETRSQADILVVQTHSGTEYESNAPDEDEPGGAWPGFPDDHEAMHEHEPAIEANELGAEGEDFRFRNEPSDLERALRRMALDLGADILINHHPHVLQGFESYDGKLIAHSLGNFIFDLAYAETMPTIVLTLEMDKSGIRGYSFAPAWIDDYITHPAVGQLGREIMDRLADYSRPMGALVATDAAAARARIFLDPGDVQAQVQAYQTSASFRVENGYALSEPIAVTGPGSLSRIVGVTGAGLGSWEICWGREILWHGNFEDEGASFWQTGGADEWLDDTEAAAGLRSLALRRDHNDNGPAGVDLERHLPCDPDKRHSVAGSMQADNADGANVWARFYSSRSNETPVGSGDLGAPFTGSADWFKQWAELETPNNGLYFELRCNLDPPESGEGLAWFDELKFIEWEPWQLGQADIPVEHPANYRFIQIRSDNLALSSADVAYEETVLVDILTAAGDQPGAAPAGQLLQNYPNPFNPSTQISLLAPSGAGRMNVSLDVFDVSGRKIARLFAGVMPGGARRLVTWNGLDDAGRALPSGVYFARARFGDRTESRKMILLK